MKKGSVQQKKLFYPVSDSFREYLTEYKRAAQLPVHYENLLQSVDSYPQLMQKMKTLFGKPWFMISITGKKSSTV